MKTYLVGGAVRDQLLGYPYHERDWVVVGARAEQLLEQGYQQVGKDFPVFLHPDTKEEYALARTERKTSAGYTGFDCFSSPEVTLEEDLQRRDLTINAMAQDTEGNITDPYGGQQDLLNKQLRHVSAAFTEDPLRILRVARFHARYGHLGFQVADETMQLMKILSASGELTALPAERVWKEFERSLSEQSPQLFFATLKQAGALEILMPELCDLSPTAATALATLASEAQASKDHNKQYTTPIKFSLLFFGMEKIDCEQCCQRIKAPNEFRELALLVNQYARDIDKGCDKPEKILQLLEQTDAFRRPQRFDDLLMASSMLFKQQTTTEKLRQALSLCNTVNASDLAAQGLKGKAIGAAIRTKRIEAISQLKPLEHSHE